MIEKTIIDVLKADPVLKSRVTRYNSTPAVFSELAPEQAKTPYVTIDLTRSKSSGDLILHDFILMVDFWDYGTSRKKAREASERIEYLFDNKQFNHERYSKIRIWWFSGGWVVEEDLRAIHYNQQFSVRACRKKWIDQL